MTRPPRTVQTARRRALVLLGGGLWAAGLGWCARLAAAVRPVRAFQAEAFDEAMQALFGTRAPEPSAAVRIGVAGLAENGAVVPVKVETDLEDVRAITLLATKNPVPMIARFEFAPGVDGFVATRVKLAETSDLVAVAETAAGAFVARQRVEVTIGGCGG